MVEKTLAFPDRSWTALMQLARITGADDISGLVRDALRTYEWLLVQQGLGREIFALERPDVHVLEESPDIQGGRPVLDPLAPESQRDEAQAYAHAMLERARRR